MNANDNPTLTTESGVTFYFEDGGLVVAGAHFKQHPLTNEELDLFSFLIETEQERRGTYGIPPQINVDSDSLNDMPLIQLQYIAWRVNAAIVQRLKSFYSEHPILTLQGIEDNFDWEKGAIGTIGIQEGYMGGNESMQYSLDTLLKMIEIAATITAAEAQVYAISCHQDALEGNLQIVKQVLEGELYGKPIEAEKPSHYDPFPNEDDGIPF